jgi:DNA-binding XRE family transcriptional regulator
MVSPSSHSPIEQLYGTKEFIAARDQNVSSVIAESLVQLRRIRHKSQEELAAAIGTSQSQIARIESGNENVTVGTIERVIKYLGGRFHVATPPLEWEMPFVRSWWHLRDTAGNHPGPFDTWQLVGMRIAIDQTAEYHRFVVSAGFQKPVIDVNDYTAVGA